MVTPDNADLVAEALRRYFRNPVQYWAEMLHANEVTGNLEIVVRLALGKPVEFTDPALRMPGVARELAGAALFFVGQTLFREGAGHYQILGLTSEASANAIRENHRLLIQLVHPDRHNDGVVWPESVAARVNRAYSELKNADSRAAYDQTEADARSKLGAMTGKAATFSASARRIVRKPRPVQLPVLPEWLTGGVGGFVRQHLAFTIFASLISLSVLIISGSIWSEREGTLTRDLPRIASTERTGPGARFSGMRPNYGAKAPRAVPDFPTLPPSTQPVLTTEKPGGQPAPIAPDGPMVRDPASPSPVTNRGFGRAPELAMATPLSRPQSAIGASASERPALPGIGAPAVTKASFFVETAPSPPRRPGLQDQAAIMFESAVAATAPAGVAPRQTPYPQVAATPAPPPVAPSTLAPPPAPAPPIQTLAAANVAPAKTVAAPSRTEPSADSSSQAPSSAEVEDLVAAFISHYEGGRLDAFTALFDLDARTNEFSGRAAIRNGYDQLFRQSSWRRINLRQLQWRAVGERTEANGEIAVKIGWRDGREVEQRIVLDMELMRRGDQTVIARLSQQVLD